MSDERKRSDVPRTAGIILVLVGLYVGAYYSMVKPVDFGFHEPFPAYPPVAPFDVSNLGNVDWHYKAVARWGTFFAPIHSLDRRIRPHVWEPKP